MKKIFRKAITVLGSAALIGSTIGMAAAAAYPVPFVENGAANVAIVTGANAAISDVVGAANLASDLATALAAQTASGGTGASISGDAWLVGTSSDLLEIGESIKDTDTYIDSEDLSILADGSIINSKGTATYEQDLYFEDTITSMVNYTENDDDVLADFFQIGSGKVIARYVLDFSKTLDTDVTSGVLDDIQDEDITILGKTYTITSAVNSSGNAVALTLISGADKATITSGEEITVGGYTVSAVVSSSTAVQFTIDGSTVDKMNKGDIEPIPGTDAYLAVTDISYESFSGGLHTATFWIGADKVILKDGASLEVNGETINNAAVTITKTNTDDIAISEIAVNMTADEDYFIPVGGKLTEQIKAGNDDPAVLLGGNWDVEFAGYEAQDTETISLKPSESDKQYTLKFDNYLGNEVSLPLLYTNNSGVHGGDSADKKLVFFCNDSGGFNITKNDYFVLNTGNAALFGGNVKTFVVQYRGADSRSDTTPQATFDILGVEDGKQVSVETAVSTYRGTRITLKLGGSTFNFMNTTTAESDDFDIALNGVGTSCGVSAETAANCSVSLLLRTEYNTLINITDRNYSSEAITQVMTGVYGPINASWLVNVSIDDTARDDDDVVLPQTVLFVRFDNVTDADTSATVTKLPANSWSTDPDNSDKSSYRTTYGALIEETDGSDSPAEEVITIPKNILHPLVYVSAGAVTINTGSTTAGATALGAVTVEDSEVASVSGKNLIVIGGSCINTVAADLLGSAACGADFTALTTVAAGEFLIESFDRSGKTALLVAGYNAEDTTKAVTYLTNTAVTTDVTTKLKGTSATEATAITATA